MLIQYITEPGKISFWGQKKSQGRVSEGRKEAGDLKICGIICEYNPMHKGHVLHIRKTKEQTGATHIIGVMSGNYVQRGEPAILNKGLRTEIALRCGLDLVVELPVCWSVTSAELFAKAAVFLLHACGCVELMSFGSECGDLERMQLLAAELKQDVFDRKLKKMMVNGVSYARAAGAAVKALYGDEQAELLLSPNNVLAVEYLKALDYFGSAIKPVTVRRDTAAGGEAYTSSDVRKKIFEGKLACIEEMLPRESFQLISRAVAEGSCPVRLPEVSLLSYLRRLTPELLRCYTASDEGLHFRVFHCIQKTNTLQELYHTIKCKRYPLARIRRILLSAYLDLNLAEMPEMPPYIRILGFSRKGEEILRMMKKTALLPILSLKKHFAAADENIRRTYDKECLASDLYQLMASNYFACPPEHSYTPVTIDP